jgi:transglutaminase-like putative cysteine protease
MLAYWRTIRDDLPSFVVLTLLMLTAVGAVVLSGWSDNMGLLITLTLIALVSSYLLVISAFPDAVILLFTTVYGAFATWWLVSARFIPETLSRRERLLEALYRFGDWIGHIADGSISRDNLIFVSLLGLLCWFLAFNATANLFRSRRLWYATIPPGLALLINTYYYSGPIRMDLFLIGYLLLTFTLAVYSNVVIRERMWMHRQMDYTPGVRQNVLLAGIGAVIVLVGLAWLAPGASASDRLASTWNRSLNPWHRVQDTFNRLFGGVEGEHSPTPTYYGGPTLTLGGAVNLGNQTVMLVSAPQGHHYYWRSSLFDTYQDGRWSAEVDARLQSDFGILPREEETPYQLRRSVQQRFEIAIPSTQLIYAAPQPTSFSSLPVRYDAAYTIPGSTEFVVTSAVRARDLLGEGESYGATSSISIADEASLRAAGGDYPAWVTDRYLQLPGNITQRTRDLASRLTAPYETVYDRASAVEGYLRETIRYNEQIQPPPPNAEPVDYVLFESQEGYCTYYATAMVVLLRAQGIPARVAAGFAQGTFDTDQNAYRVLESDAHTWVEVYFPGFGWIEFEPTAAESPVARPEVNVEPFVVESTGPDDPALDEGAGPDDPATGDENADPATRPARTLIARLFAVVRWALTVLLVLGGIGAGFWLWLRTRGLTAASEVSRSYARLNTFAPWVGVELEPSATPSERTAPLSRAVPTEEKHVTRIIQLYIKEQYAPPPPTPAQRHQAEARAKEAWGELQMPLVRAAILKWLNKLNPFRRG